MAGRTVRIAAVGDLHCTRTSQGAFQPWLARAADSADVLLLAGDLTDFGLVEEAKVLARELAGVRTTIIAVLGNHDVESGQEEEVARVLGDAGVKVLNGDVHEAHGIGFAGIKGFCGGFGRRALGPWGEAIIKQFVREAIDQALKLEAALARLRTPQRIVLLHYSPIEETVAGEPLEIFPFLGSSRLEEPIAQYPTTLVVHGHAHRGQLEGRTKSGVPVYNVAMQLLARRASDAPPYRVFDVHVDDAPPERPVGRRSTDLVSP